MNCQIILDKLSAYQDGELSVSERGEVEKHLSICSTCRAEFAKLQQTWEALGGLSDLSVSPGFYREIQQRLSGAVKGTLREPAYSGWFQRLLPTSAVAFLTAAGIVLGAVAGNSLIARNPAQPSHHEDSLLSSLSVFDPVPPGTLADALSRLMARDERRGR